MNDKKVRKHVIFLGAGASYGSGYPLANELRLRISSKEHFDKYVTNYEQKHGLMDRRIATEVQACLERHNKALTLFRNGGFATLDEFCKLAGGFEFRKEIDGMRCLVRGALGLCNPEETFHTSEYYSLVQSVFQNDLLSLRDDISILTYNYDPYLEYLLHRALKHRRKVASKGVEMHTFNSVTSGFYEPNNHEWLVQDKQQKSFCVLQLHGSICFTEQALPVNHAILFEERPLARQCLFQHAGDSNVPPVLFPWEVMSPRGFTEKSDFPLKDTNGASMYGVFRGIWERARREVQAAEKISFVGLSFHPFMLDGLRYLFEGKTGAAEVVVANVDNVPFDQGRTETHWLHQPHKAAYELNEVLKKTAPNLRKVGRALKQRLSADEITLVKDFAGFIRTQMRPIVSDIHI